MEQQDLEHPDKTRRGHRPGRWMPDQDALEDWLEGITDAVEAKPADAPLQPAVEGLRDLLDRDPVARMLFTQMIEQVPHSKKYRKRHLTNVDQLLRLIDEVIGRAPEYNETGLVGVPLNAVLDWCMGTPAGFAAFRLDAVNAAFRTILRAWCDFLSGPGSLHVLNDSPRGWFCESARKSTGIDQFHHDPKAPHRGFASWNDFFTRRFKEGRRPVAEPDDAKVIVAACEATPYAIGLKAKRQDRFWVKAQPYSLRDMLDDDEDAAPFVGGTVYQAFLDAHNYHRWHSPVSGTVRKAFVKEGTYYSEAESEGQDPEGPKKSQGYLAHVATRAILLVEADDPVIGLIALMFIGMAEVSSCVFHPQIQAGHRLTKGDEVGYFQFGGSTYCMIFRPGAVAEFAVGALPDPHAHSASLVLVNSRLARSP
ncbi:MAG TPA: phosphatidylserine decarboxylase family protein [Isosphaeraceae bacterium]|jgi:phosphatidylserine decarboxylase|nr:phosphatidylserine decarboxylase family protein [Isosphaeraceae bacterium]